MRIIEILTFLFLAFILNLLAPSQAASTTVKYTLTIETNQCKFGNRLLAKLTITNLSKADVWMPKYGIYEKTNYCIVKLPQELNPPQLADPKKELHPVPVGHYPENYESVAASTPLNRVFARERI